MRVFQLLLLIAVTPAALCSPGGARQNVGSNPEDHIFKGKICRGSDGRAAILEKLQAEAQCMVTKRKRGGHYVLSNLESKTIYRLDGHSKPRAFAGDNVVVIGTLDNATGTIYVKDMFRALPPAVMRAKSVYTDCDACLRGMAKARPTALQELTNWGRFKIVPDAREADLIFLLSANPYLGDFITRDGPDKRPVRVDVTYMDVVDPHRGESFWDDSRQWGSLFVARATKDLIAEFKERLEIEERAVKDQDSLLRLPAER